MSEFDGNGQEIPLSDSATQDGYPVRDKDGNIIVEIGNLTSASHVVLDGAGGVVLDGSVVIAGSGYPVLDGAGNVIIAGGGFPGSVVELDASNSQSAISSTEWKDLRSDEVWTGTNTVLNGIGYDFSGTGTVRPSTNPTILNDLHKSTISDYTVVLTGTVGTLDNDWLMSSFPSSGIQNGWGLKWQGDTDLQFVQYTNGSLVDAVPIQLPNSTEFIIIFTREASTGNFRIWVNDYNTGATGTLTYATNTNEPDGLFTLGGFTNGGSFNGTLRSFMVLDQYIDVAKAGQIITYYNGRHNIDYAVRALNALFVGQSNMEKLFTDFAGAGATQYETTAGAYYDAVVTIDGAKAGAAVHFAAENGFGAYLNATNDGKGTVYTTDLEGAVTAAGVDNENIDVIYMLIGETDAVAVDADTITEAQHKAAYETLISLLKTDFPNARIMPTPLMADTNGNEFDGWGEVRRAQYEAFNDDGTLIESPAMYDLSFADDLHLDQAGYEAMATRLAERCAAIDGKRTTVGTIGASIVSAEFSVSSQSVDVTIAHDAGTDFTISEFKGIVANVNGTGVAASAVSRVDATTFRATFPASTFGASDTVTLDMPWGTLKGYTQANIFIDNAITPLPLRESFSVSVAFDGVGSGAFLYLRPASTDNYLQPDGTSLYQRP